MFLSQHNFKGSTSFEDIRTVYGTVCSIYRDACFKRDLLKDDAQLDATLTEEFLCQSFKKS